MRNCGFFPRETLAVVLALSVSVGACADPPTATMETPQRASASLAVPTPSDAQTVAQGLALALRDASIRKLVHGAMRTSRLNEHKLVLQDILNTAAGETVLSAAAQGLNLTPNSLKGAIANLPRLDFYVPFKAHRLSWKPTSDVYVTTTFDPDAPTITAYGTNGLTVTLRKDRGVPDIPLIILHPAEPTATRDTPQADTPGDVIQEPTDGQVATRFVASAPSSPAFLIEDPGGGGGSISPPPPVPGTYINHFNIQVGDGWFGDSEMQFRSFAMVGYQGFVGPLGQYPVTSDICPLGTYAQDGVVEDQGYDGLYLISPGITTGTFVQCHGQPAIYAINIVEIDGGIMGEDDDYGWRLYAQGGYPLGAMYNTVESYYENTSNTQLRTAYLRITLK